jgi:hypothetical protein
MHAIVLFMAVAVGLALGAGRAGVPKVIARHQTPRALFGLAGIFGRSDARVWVDVICMRVFRCRGGRV